MPKYKIENIRAALTKLLTPTNFSLLSGRETEVKPGVFIKLIGPMDFKIVAKNNAIEIDFKIMPEIRVDKFFQFMGDIRKVIITLDKIELIIDGLPDTTLEVVS